jgi:GNAT superfamily N-acetyltransferase
LARETEDLNLEPDVVRAGVAGVLGESSRGLYFLAEIGGTVAGQIMITYEWSDWRNGTIWWIQSVYVAAPFRRTGVFRALFEHVKTLAQGDKTVCGIRLYVHGTNNRAQDTYERMGMHRTQYQVFEMEL